MFSSLRVWLSYIELLFLSRGYDIVFILFLVLLQIIGYIHAQRKSCQISLSDLKFWLKSLVKLTENFTYDGYISFIALCRGRIDHVAKAYKSVELQLRTSVSRPPPTATLVARLRT